MQNAVGWSASVLLLITIGWQILRQWRSGTSKGVSHWLFIGQMAASAMFTVYSIMIGNVVFIATNTLMLLSAIVGLGIVVHHRRTESE